MLAALAVAGLIAFASGFVLRIGAFAIFALMTAALYFCLLIHQNHGIPAALGFAVLFAAVMQVCYAIGVLFPSLMSRTTGRRLPARGQPAEPRDGSRRGNTRPL